jgi:hypothetical protein
MFDELKTTMRIEVEKWLQRKEIRLDLLNEQVCVTLDLIRLLDFLDA